MRRLIPHAAAAAGLSALLACGPAQALFGDDEARKAILDLRTRVTEMEERLQKQAADQAADLSRRVDRIEAAQTGSLEIANQIDAMRQDVAKLRGQVETLANEIAKAQQRNRDLYADLDARLKKLEPTAITVDGRAAQVERSEQAAYDGALAQFRASDFKGAVVSLGSFVARFPQSPYAASAQYWLGNSHYALKDFRSAITALTTVVDRYPDSPRAPEALLNIANSQIELADRRTAKTTLQRIVQNYPDSEAAKLAAERIKTLGNR
jgi:tol-pal system protein YbgF